MKFGRDDLWATPDSWRRQLFRLATRGPSNLARMVKIWTFCQFSRDFDTTKGSRRGQGAQEVSEGLLGTVWFDPIRHLPTAGVCNRHLGMFPRLLPTAGVCDQHLGKSFRLLLSAGECNQCKHGRAQCLAQRSKPNDYLTSVAGLPDQS